MKMQSDGISTLTRKRRPRSASGECKDEAGVYVRSGGKRIWKKLGMWNDPDIKKVYERFLAVYYGQAIDIETPKRDENRILAALFNLWLDRPSRQPGTAEYDRVRTMMRIVLEVLPGTTPLRDITATAFRVARDAIIAEGLAVRDVEYVSKSGKRFTRKKQAWSRHYTNNILNAFRLVLRWGMSWDLVEPDAMAKIDRVPGVSERESDLVELKKVDAVSDDVLRQTLPWLNPVVRDMVKIQRACCMRPSEVCRLLVMDIDQSSDVWTATIHNKVERCGVKRIVAFGPAEREVLARRMKGKNLESHIFSPRDAMSETWDEKREARKSPVQPSQKERDAARKETRLAHLRDAYSAQSYGRSVCNALAKAKRHGVNIPHWFPYQIRHQAYTCNSLLYGCETASYVAGHTTADMAKVYDHKATALAVMAASERCAWW